MRLSSGDFARVVMRANLAPSVHNTQLTRWRLHDDGSVVVLEDATRRLPVADPAGRDAAVSHGCGIEGFALACADMGIAVDVGSPDAVDPSGLRPVARLTLRAGGQPDPLSAFVPVMRTYRGAFSKRPAAETLDSLRASGDVTLVTSASGRARIAELNDLGSIRTYRDKPYRRELRSWLRLSRRDPRWALDGLNAEAMAMSPIAAAGAAVILAPGSFETLDRIGAARHLVAEAAVVSSAEAVVLFHRPLDEDPLQTGRRFHRLWLEFTALGRSAAPMSVLADDEEIRSTIAREFDVPVNRRLINGFRIGVPPPRTSGDKARLPRNVLIMDDHARAAI
jgi:hypothetical protein